jgi:predicted RNase H-like HicB family nuclease
MTSVGILTDYIAAAMGEAEYDKLEDGTFAGRVPSCPGAIAFGDTLRGCEEALHSTLEEWVLLGLKLSHHLPVLGNIDLDREPVCEPMDAV